ncbi:MAG: hybrid sensor histidine kinase/response regulator [Magnetococcales bacterium]|nr:hybrid sensor histidine kinase/response regulator [Magnetococcales bacterium]
MIEDSELRELFRAESDEHLQKLNDGLLALEKEPGHSELLKELFREAHSLKGSARMLGVDAVETLAHSFEDLLGAASKGLLQFSPELIDRLEQGLDHTRHLVREAVTGEPSPVTLMDALRQLQQPDAVDVHPDAPVAAPPAPVTLPPPPVTPPPAPVTPPPALEPVVAETERIDTIRVDTRKLDRIFNQTGELTALGMRMKRRLTDIQGMITLAEGLEHHGQLLDRLRLFRHALMENQSTLDAVSRDLDEGIRNLRLLPLTTLFNLFPRMVRDLSRQLTKQVELLLEGGEITVDKRVIEELKNPLMHLLRNAIHHAIEPAERRAAQGKPAHGVITLRATRTPASVMIEVCDDGRGIDLDAIRREAVRHQLHSAEELSQWSPEQLYNLLFVAGLSTASMVTDISGRGIGLNAVRADIERLKGTVRVQSTTGQGTTFTISLPVTLSTTPVIIVRLSDRFFALPLDGVQMVRRVTLTQIFLFEGYRVIALETGPVAVVHLAELLGLPISTERGRTETASVALECLIIVTGHQRLALFVDEIVDQLDVVVKPNGVLLKRVPHLAGSTLLGSGGICSVLNVADLLKSARQQRRCDEGRCTAPTAATSPLNLETSRKQRILLVEDSITTRTQEKRILEGAGYDVMVAVDGLDAWHKLALHPFDAVVSDVQMPNLDGLGLTAKIRQHQVWHNLPVMLVTSLASEADLRRGLEVGASAYITKPTFEQKVFLDTLRRLL